MTHPKSSAVAERPRQTVARRDWLLLPLIALIAVVSAGGAAEFASRRIFSLGGEGIGGCIVTNDPVTGTRGLPNSSCREKHYESQLVEYRFNSCGHRTTMQCASPPDGEFRIVMAGSSFTAGALVQAQESFAELLPGELSQRTGRPIEVYNAGISHNGFPSVVEAQWSGVLAQHPDLIILVVTPWDLEKAPLGTADREHAIVSTDLLNRLGFYHLRLIFALRHTLYLSPSQYLRSWMLGDQESGFLKSEWAPDWRARMNDFEAHFAGMARGAHAAGVPLAVMPVPDRAQAIMISMGKWPPGYDPYEFGEELRSMAARHGADYVDILPDFRNVPNAGSYYMPIDGHPYPSGHILLAKMIADHLAAGSAPLLQPGHSASTH